MSVVGTSRLRMLMEKWLPREGRSRFRIERLRRGAPRTLRVVSVEITLQSGPATLIFFQHDNGVWHVFPPQTQSPCMSIEPRGPAIVLR